MSVLPWRIALLIGYAPDKRRRRRQHRRNARALLKWCKGIPTEVAKWHLQQARLVKTQPPKGVV